ncbi:MAG: hypothetical protein IJQ31_08685 [Thermoguttaceae bacterium]|nr:hypothetical protein [Thermoguttaceae bacterium]
MSSQTDQEHQEVCFKSTCGHRERVILAVVVQALLIWLYVGFITNICMDRGDKWATIGAVLLLVVLNLLAYLGMVKLEFPPIELFVSQKGIRCNKMKPDLSWKEISEINYETDTRTFTCARIKITKENGKKLGLVLFFRDEEEAQKCFLTIQRFHTNALSGQEQA